MNQSPKPELSVWDFIKEFFKAFIDVESGFLATFKMMFINPGAVIDGYISERKYYPPFRYLALSVAIETSLIGLAKWVLSNSFSPMPMFSSDQFPPEALKYFANYFNDIVPYVDFLYIIPMTACSYLFFYTYRVGLVSHLILNGYTLAQVTFITFPNYLVMSLLPTKLAMYFLMLIYLIWTVIGIRSYLSFFSGKPKLTFILAVLTLVAAIIIYYVMIGIGFGIYIVLHGAKV